MRFPVHVSFSGVFIVALLFGSPLCSAQSDSQPSHPLVRVSTDIEPDSSVQVGQRVRLILDVLSQDGWANVKTMPELELAGTVVYLPSGQSVRLNETVQGKAFSGQRNEWWLYPQRPGKYQVPSLKVNVLVNTYDANSDPTVHEMTTEPVAYPVVHPSGLDGKNGVVASDQFSAEQTWSPKASQGKALQIQVGDGVTRQVVRTIGGAPALVLPEIAFADVPGTTTYEKDPQTKESNQRGSLTSTRTDRATYVFHQAGKVTLPAIVLRWWNTKTQAIESVTLEGQSVEVSPTTRQEQQSPDSQDGRGTGMDFGQPASWVIAGGLATCFACVLGWWNIRTTAKVDTESNRYRDFIRVSKSGETLATLQAFFHWASSLQTSTNADSLEEFFLAHGCEDTQPLQDLYQAMDRGDKRFDATRLVEFSRQARRRCLDGEGRNASRNSPLPALNG